MAKQIVNMRLDKEILNQAKKVLGQRKRLQRSKWRLKTQLITAKPSKFQKDQRRVRGKL